MDHRFIVSPSGKFESKEAMEVIFWSAHSHEDVTGTATTMSRLSLQEIKGLWAGIEQELPVDIKEQGHQTFLDLLSICATNPCVKYII